MRKADVEELLEASENLRRLTAHVLHPPRSTASAERRHLRPQRVHERLEGPDRERDVRRTRRDPELERANLPLAVGRQGGPGEVSAGHHGQVAKDRETQVPRAQRPAGVDAGKAAAGRVGRRGAEHVRAGPVDAFVRMPANLYMELCPQ